MRKLFLGFFLILLDFPFSLANSTLQLLPDWLGYLLLLAGCTQLENESELFGKIRAFCLALCVFSAFIWLIDFAGIGIGSFGNIVRLVYLCLRLYFIRSIINAVAQTEMKRNYDLSSAQLRRVWLAVAVCTAAAVLLLWFPAMAVICAIAADIAGIIFLFAFHGTRKSYEQMPADYAQGF